MNPFNMSCRLIVDGKNRTNPCENTVENPKNSIVFYAFPRIFFFKIPWNSKD